MQQLAARGNTRIHPQETSSTTTQTNQFEGHEQDSHRIEFRNWMEILYSCNNHIEFFFFTVLVATIRQLVDSMELGLFIWNEH